MNRLTIELTGKVLNSNFDRYKSDLIEQIRSADVPLRSDADFDAAAERVKFFKRAEKALVDAKQSALDQAGDIQDLFAAIDDISRETRNVRLALERQIKSRRTSVREELIDDGLSKIVDSLARHPDEFQNLARPQVLNRSRFLDTIKGKTITGAVFAIDALVRTIQSEIALAKGQYDDNLKSLEQLRPEEMLLFQDRSSLLGLEPDRFKAIMTTRLDELEKQRIRSIDSSTLSTDTGNRAAHSDTENRSGFPETSSEGIESGPAESGAPMSVQAEGHRFRLVATFRTHRARAEELKANLQSTLANLVNDYTLELQDFEG